MGRAIDMEKDIDMLKTKVEKLENIVRGMTHTMSERKHIDLVEDVKPQEIEEEQSIDIKGVEEACEDALDELSEKDAAKAAAPKKNAGNSKNKK